jgi:hypothetical protein
MVPVSQVDTVQGQDCRAAEPHLDEAGADVQMELEDMPAWTY